MSISPEQKQQVIKEYAIKANDTGSPEVQIAIMTTRIKNLTDHMSAHKKDFHSRRGLLILVSKRRRLLQYLERESVERYQNLIKRLELRR
ncbi:MAG: 30S ribosomal protein S15 [Alphaproteobacteria bacterium]|nr:30S ribosomal protein S15 [Alphaproteobacteria bacterium]